VPAPRPTFLRPLAAGVAVLGLALALAACGGSTPANAPTSTGPGGQRGGGFAAAQDPKVQACLKKAGATLPSFGGRRPGAGPPATGTQTAPRRPAGATPRAPGGPGRDPAQFAKLRAALAKCGVTLPDRGPGGPGGGPAAPATTS
jgi:hypothetical protein